MVRPGNDHRAAVQEEQRRQRVSIFAPAFSRLVEVIRGHCRYPDNWRSLDRAERSEFKRSRIAIGDTLTDAAGERRQAYSARGVSCRQLRCVAAVQSPHAGLCVT